MHEFVKECGNDVLATELVESTASVVKLLGIAHVPVRCAIDEVGLVSIANEWIIGQKHTIHCECIHFQSVR